MIALQSLVVTSTDRSAGCILVVVVQCKGVDS